VVAENKLGNAAVLERLQAVQGFPTAVMNYSGWVCGRGSWWAGGGRPGIRARQRSIISRPSARREREMRSAPRLPVTRSRTVTLSTHLLIARPLSLPQQEGHHRIPTCQSTHPPTHQIGWPLPRPVVRLFCSMKGIPEFQACMAALMERTFLPGHTVDPNDLCISSGGWTGGWVGGRARRCVHGRAGVLGGGGRARGLARQCTRFVLTHLMPPPYVHSFPTARRVLRHP